jgi:hypothetical protein
VTRIAFLADVHLGNHQRHGGPVRAGLNRRCREALDAFRCAVNLVDTLGCNVGVVLGDLLDYQRPEAQLLAEVQTVLRESSVVWNVTLGNHEMVSTADGDHALGPLGVVANVHDRPELAVVRHDVELAVFPFRPGAPAAEWLPGALAETWPAGRPHQAEHAVLGVHLGVSDASTAPWLRGAHDSVDVDLLARLAAAYRVSHVFAGNWHDRRTWTVGVNDPPPLRSRRAVCVTQLGALVPTGWDNPGVEGYGTVAVWDGGAVELHEVPGPRFLKLRGFTPSQVRAAAEAARARGHVPYVDATVGPGQAEDARAVLRALGVRGDVSHDAEEASAEARTAATVARSADTLDSALAGFVRAAPLPELAVELGEDPDAFRAEVLSESRRYLAGAS